MVSLCIIHPQSTEEVKKKTLTKEQLQKKKDRRKRKTDEKQKRKSEKPKKVEKPKKTRGKEEVFKNIFSAKPKNFGIGNDLPHALNLTRFVKWPKYVRLQRQRRILYKRLRVPPAINQFNYAVSKQLALRLLKLLQKYRPEEKREVKKRQVENAEKKKKGEKETVETKKATVTYGLNEVVTAIEKKKATLVVIAHDVEPIEQVVYLPALCKKMGIPYCIIKSKARLGKVVHQKHCAALAFTQVNSDDKSEFEQLVAAVNTSFAEKYSEVTRKWGGVELSQRSQRKN